MQIDPQKHVPPPESPQDSFIAPNRSAIAVGIVYLFLHMFLLGEVIFFFIRIFDLSPTLIEINLIYMFPGALVLTLTMWRYLAESFDRFRAYGVKNLAAFGIGYAIRFAGSIPITILIMIFIPDFITTPNSEVVLGMATSDFFLTAFLAIVLAPIVEELLFRAALFGALRKKNRILAYVISTLAFAFLHVLSFLLFSPSPALLLIMLSYFPAGIALAWSYEKSGSIWTAIFLHALMNAVAIGLGSFVLQA